jgi:hypothetical protein
VSYLTRLKTLLHEKPSPDELTKPTKGTSVSSVSDQGGHFWGEEAAIEERAALAADCVPPVYLDAWARRQCQRPFSVGYKDWRLAIDDGGLFSTLGEPMRRRCDGARANHSTCRSTAGGGPYLATEGRAAHRVERGSSAPQRRTDDQAGGVMARRRDRIRLEDGLRFDLNCLIRQNLLRRGAVCRSSFHWSYRYSGDVIASGWVSADLTEERRGWLRLEVGALDQRIALEAAPRHFGGRQWYFVCPRTGLRASVLWRPPGARSFASRHAWGRQVAYGSQFETPYDRALSAAHDIRYKLGGKIYVSLDEISPPKPKGMHSRTYERIVGKCEGYEAIVNQRLIELLSRLK